MSVAPCSRCRAVVVFATILGHVVRMKSVVFAVIVLLALGANALTITKVAEPKLDLCPICLQLIEESIKYVRALSSETPSASRSTF